MVNRATVFACTVGTGRPLPAHKCCPVKESFALPLPMPVRPAFKNLTAEVDHRVLRRSSC